MLACHLYPFHLNLCLFDKLLPSEFVDLDLVRHVWDENCNDNLDSDKYVLHQDAEKYNVCPIPEINVLSAQPLDYDRLLFFSQCV